MGKYAKPEPRPLSQIAVIDEAALDQIVENIEIPAANWGNIGGTLSAQTDVSAAINGKETANSNIQTHVTSSHAPATAQKNSDITKGEIEAKLTGELTSHSHAGGGGGLSQAQILTRQL